MWKPLDPLMNCKLGTSIISNKVIKKYSNYRDFMKISKHIAWTKHLAGVVE